MMKFGRMGAGSSIPWTPTKYFGVTPGHKIAVIAAA